MSFGVLTKTLRHKIVKIIAPKLYLDAQRKEFLRPMIHYLMKTRKNYTVIGAEIGVRAGKNAYNMFQVLSSLKLYAVDPYSEYYEVSGEIRDSTTQRAFEQQAHESLQGYNVKWIKKLSQKAIDDIPEDLDFVYIDANHKYECVKSDLQRYYSILKTDGVLGGHDFDSMKFKGLVKAVLEFMKINNLFDCFYVSRSDYWFDLRELSH
jgi:plasmid maintenance system killer protein